MKRLDVHTGDLTITLVDLPDDLPEPRRQNKTRRTVDLGHSSDGQSWIDLAEIRVTTTESRVELVVLRPPRK